MTEGGETPGALPDDWQQWRRDVDLDDYDARWRRLAEAGVNPHGEADLVSSYAPATVLDAGCGTGRVAIELARRGMRVVGVDRDEDMIARARAKSPTVPWLVSDLGDLDLPDRFDVVVLAGNVVPYVEADRRPAAVLGCARHLAPGGVLVAGFGLRPGWPAVADYDLWCERAGLLRQDRWSTWDREPFTADSPYVVAVHRRPVPGGGRD